MANKNPSNDGEPTNEGTNTFCGEWGYRLKSSNNGYNYDGFLIVSDHKDGSKAVIQHYRLTENGREFVEEITAETFDGYPAMIRFRLSLAPGMTRYFTGTMKKVGQLVGFCLPPPPPPENTGELDHILAMQAAGDEWMANRPP